MSNTRIPSPARSLGGIRTPRRYIKRRTRSVNSPTRSNVSGRLTAIMNMNLPVALSPLPSRRSVLTDSTDIQEPRRKSWWREIDENTENVLDVLENVATGNTNDDIEELIDMEVLSQEKNNIFDLPESSDNESINSIVLPERKLFTKKGVQPQKKFVQLIGNRESLAKHKNSCDNDKTVIAGTRDLLQSKKPRTKPQFPAELLSVSPNKTKVDIDINTEASNNQVRNIFNSRPPTKRKNMFAEFIITESEDEITEIQPKVLEFHKNVRVSQQLRKRSLTPNITDSEMDDWVHLPSSTMVDKQIEEVMVGTPKQKSRLSKLSELDKLSAKPAVIINTTDQSKNTTEVHKDNNPIFQKIATSNRANDINIDNLNKPAVLVNPIDQSENAIEVHKDNNQFIKKTASILSRNSTNNINTGDLNEPEDVVNPIDQSENATEVYKDDNQIIQKTASVLSSNSTNNINIGDINKPAVLVNSIDQSENATEVHKDNNQFIKKTASILSSDSTNNINTGDLNELEALVNPIDQSENATEVYKDDNQIIQKTASVLSSNSTNNIKIGDLNKPAVLVNSIDQAENATEIQKDNNQIIQKSASILSSNSTNNINTDDINEPAFLVNPIDRSKNATEVHKDNNQIIQKTAAVLSSNSTNNINICDLNEPAVLVNPIDQSENAIEVHKDNNQIIQKTATRLSSDITSGINMNAENEPEVAVNTIGQSKNIELGDEADDNNFTLQYENDDEYSPVISDDVNNVSNIQKSISSPLEFKNMQENMEVENYPLELNVDSNNIGSTENSKQESVNNEESLIKDEEDQNESDYNLVDTEKSQNNSAQEDDENRSLIDQDDKEDELKEETDDIENSLQGQDKSGEIEIDEYEEDEDDIVHESDVDECDMEENEPDNEYGANEISNSGNRYSNDNQEVEQVDEDDNELQEEESKNATDKTEANMKSPEIILHDRTNRIDSFIGGHNSVRKTKSLMLKSPDIDCSMAKAQDVTGFSEGTRNSSAEDSHWDSHRTTRKTLRHTLGRDFTLRKSLRTLVMEKSMKRQTAQTEMNWETTKYPEANSTELPEVSNNQDHDMDADDSIEQSVHEISKRTRQATLEMCFQKMKQKNMEQRLKIEESVRNSLRHQPSGDIHLFKVPKKPVQWRRPPTKPTQSNNPRSKRMKSLIPCEDLPAEILEDLKYKPPKRFKPSNASWITPRLYKHLENKLEPKYDYKARMRAEKLVETIYEFAKSIRRNETAPDACAHALKLELARLDVVRTHFDFYNFFHEFMPREIRIKVVPDVVNKIPLPKHGIFSDIIRA